ncbi:large ribosomal subunit protein uL18m [Lepeophtheirus salmonis]|nr:39S ribosomal protein L18, mitochondrial-like [Lepeophtheirus salmonis]
MWKSVIRSLSSSSSQFRPRIRNKNPLNLEHMKIGYKPQGFLLDKKSVSYWNRLFLEISQNHTTAKVIHWTGRPVAQASTREWAIRKHLYNYTDATALHLLGTIIGERTLQTGVLEVNLQMTQEELQRERMSSFVESIRKTGLSTSESFQYTQRNPFRQLSLASQKPKNNFKPWEVIDE